MPNVLLDVTPGLAAAVSGITTGRAQSLGALGLGLFSVVIGGLAGAGRIDTANRRRRAAVSLSAGLISAVFSGVRVAYAGPIGTGSGRLGAIVALVVGLIGTALGGLALARSRRTHSPGRP